MGISKHIGACEKQLSERQKQKPIRMKSIVAESDNRQSRLLFKLAVEIAILQNLIAAINDIDPISLERLRGECVKEVKRLNGSFSFEDAVDWQKG